MTLSSTLPGWEGLGDSRTAQPHGAGIPGQTFSISYIPDSLNSPSLQITVCHCEHVVDSFPNKASTGCNLHLQGLEGSAAKEDTSWHSQLTLFLPSVARHCVAHPHGTAGGRNPGNGGRPWHPGHKESPLQHPFGRALRSKTNCFIPHKDSCPSSSSCPAILLTGTSLQPPLLLTSEPPGAPGPGTSPCVRRRASEGLVAMCLKPPLPSISDCAHPNKFE